MRALLAFAVLAVAALLTFLLWPDAAAAPAHGIENAAAAAPAVTNPTETATAPSQPAEPAANVPQRQVAAETFDGPTGNVRVVLFGTDTPVAGAIVRYQPPDFDWQKLPREQVQELQLLQKDLERFLQRVGRESVTGPDGRCRVPLCKNGTPVIARSGELYGQAYLSERQKEDVPLALRSDQTLHVLALDNRGQPAARIQLLFERVAANDKDAMRWAWGATDERGRYEHAHVQTLATAAAQQARLCALPAGGSGPSVTFDLASPPPEVVVQLGPTGSVQVVVLDDTGQPLDPTFLASPEVRMAAFDKRPENSDQQNDGFNRQHWTVPIDAHSVARFPHVALGRYLVVSRDYFTTRGFDGPTAANPQVEVTLQDAADGPVLVGTLVDPGGGPFANRKFSVTARKGGGISSLEGRTDDRGHMRCALSHYAVGDDVVLTLATPQLERDDPLSIELPPRKLPAGVSDLGQVQLLPQAVLLAGRLVCDPGVAVPRVQLEVERRQDYWAQEWQLRPEWQDDGSFKIRGAMAAGTQLRLVVREGPYLPVEPIECKPGDQGIEVHLRAAGSATAVFLVDERTPVDRLQILLHRTEPPETPDQRRQMMERFEFMGAREVENGRLKRNWTGLTPGTHELKVTCRGALEPVALVEAIAIASGPCADPRLVDIDLRGRVSSFEVRATDADGQPVADREAFVVTRSQGDDWYGYNLGSGIVTLATATTVDLYVLVPGHKMASLDAVRESRTVALERAETTSLQVVMPAPLPEGVEFRLRLQPKLAHSRRASITLDNGRGMDLDSFFMQDVLVTDGVAKVRVRWTGEHTVEATVSIGNRGGTAMRDFTPKTLVLPAGPETTLKVGAKGLESALQNMRR